jgi:hypothetical protein
MSESLYLCGLQTKMFIMKFKIKRKSKDYYSNKLNNLSKQTLKIFHNLNRQLKMFSN